MEFPNDSDHLGVAFMVVLLFLVVSGAVGITISAVATSHDQRDRYVACVRYHPPAECKK